MARWHLGSEPDGSGGRETIMDIQADGVAATLKGTITFQDVVYKITGHWAASHSVPGRNYSCLALCGPSSAAAPEMIALAGTMKGSGTAPESILANLIRTDSSNGRQYGWSGTLTPIG